MVNDGNTYYDPEKVRTPWFRIIVICILIIILIIVSYFLLRNKKANPEKLYKQMLASAEKYVFSESLLPELAGQCKTIDVSEFNNKNFDDCSGSFVKVCLSTDKIYQYTPVLNCSYVQTEFDDWNYGETTDLIKGNSDVEFKFIPEQMKIGVKKYFPNNETNASKVAEYYISSPNDEYGYHDAPVIAYKWYKEGSSRVYYPSSANLSSDEKTYYIKNPASGTSKDIDTKAYAYKYYKFEPALEGSSVWVSVSDEPLTEQEIIDKFRELGYDINSLNDINEKEDIRYHVIMLYRNRK